MQLAIAWTDVCLYVEILGLCSDLPRFIASTTIMVHLLKEFSAAAVHTILSSRVNTSGNVSVAAKDSKS